MIEMTRQTLWQVNAGGRDMLYQLFNRCLIQAREGEQAGLAALLGLRQWATKTLADRVLGVAPGEQQAERLFIEPSGQVAQKFKRGFIGPVNIIEEKDARCGWARVCTKDEPDLCQPLEETAFAARTTQR